MRQRQPGDERTKASYGVGDEWKFYYDKGGVLAERGHLEESVAAFKRSLNLNPQCSWAYGNMAIILWRLNRFDEALKSIDAALQLDPADADFANTRQTICQAMESDPVPKMSGDELTIALFDALAAFDGATALKLVEAGANVNARDMHENTPLHHCFRCQDIGISERLAQALVGHGADVNARNDVGDTPWVKLQGIRHEQYKRALSAVLVRLGAKEDAGALARKRGRIDKIREDLAH